ncbi:hypothetical protein RI367_003751 [Sorochytrium milnesiophthora]
MRANAEDATEQAPLLVRVEQPRASADEDVADVSSPLTFGQHGSPPPAHASWSELGSKIFVLLRCFEHNPAPIGWALALLLGLSVAMEFILYFVGLLPSEFMAVLVSRDVPKFRHVTIKAAILVVIAGLIQSFLLFAANYFALKLREGLSHHLQKAYLKSPVFYKAWAVSNIDNIDQRITQDADKFGLTLGKVLRTVIITPPLIVYYTTQLLALSSFDGVAIIYLFFIIGSTVSYLCVRPLVRLVYLKEESEGNYRFLHTHIRTNFESIAMLRGLANEAHRALAALNCVIDASMRVIRRALLVEAVNNIVAYVGAVLNYLVVAIPVLTGRYDDLSPSELSSAISKNAFIALYLIDKLTALLRISADVGELSGYTVRLVQLMEFCTENGSDEEEDEARLAWQTAPPSYHQTIKLEDVSINTPTGHPVLHNISMEVVPRRDFVIQGKSGLGKSSILRVLAGLWPYEGHMTLPAATDLFFLPQRPYFIEGTVFEQIVYPQFVQVTEEGNAHAAHTLLHAVGLSHLSDRTSVTSDVHPVSYYQTVLSPGEQQRLAFARLLYHRPLFGLTDECTSAVDDATALRLFSAARERGITMVNVSHRPHADEFASTIGVVSKDGIRIVKNI